MATIWDEFDRQQKLTAKGGLWDEFDQQKRPVAAEQPLAQPALAQQVRPAIPNAPQPEQERGWLEFAKDRALGVGAAGLDLLGSVPALGTAFVDRAWGPLAQAAQAPMDTGLLRAFGEQAAVYADDARAIQSPYEKAAQQQMAGVMGADMGEVDRAIALGRLLIENPATAGQAADSLPAYMAAGGGIAKLVRAVSAAAVAPSVLPTQAVLAGAGSGGEAASETEQRGGDLSAQDDARLKAAAVGAGLNMALMRGMPGLNVVEDMIAGQATRGARGRLAAGLLGGVKEGASEAPQGAADQFAVNVGTGADLERNLLAAGLLEGLVGAGPGALAGATAPGAPAAPPAAAPSERRAPLPEALAPSSEPAMQAAQNADLDALLAANLPASVEAALSELGIDPSKPPPALMPKGERTTAPAVQPTAGQPAPAPAVGDFLRQVQQYQLQAQQMQPQASVSADISTDINTPQAAPQQPVRMDTEATNGRPAATPALAAGRNRGAGIAGQDRDGQPLLGRAEARPVASDPVAGQASLAQADGAVSRKRVAKTEPNGKPRDLLRVLAYGRGLDREAFRREYGVDPADFNRRVAGRPVFRKQGGMTPDEFLGFMQQEAYLAQNPPDRPNTIGNDDAFDLFDRAWRGGESVYGMDQGEAVARYEQARREADEAYRAEVEGDTDGYADEIARLVELAQDAGIPAGEVDAVALSAANDEAHYSGLSDLIARYSRERANQGTATGRDASSMAQGGTDRGSDADFDAFIGDPGADFDPSDPLAVRQQQSLFGSPTAQERLDAERQRRDAERNGLSRELVRPEQGDGDLLAGERPEQQRIEASRDMFVPTRGDRQEASRGQDQDRGGWRDGDTGPASTGRDDAGGVRLRPDATPALTRRAKFAIESLVRRFGGSVLADTIARDFRETGSTELVGKTIRSPQDLAVAAQVYRNPIFEVMRYVFVNNAGVVVGETAVSVRMPGVSPAFPAGATGTGWVKQEMARHGAAGVYFVHNHPSGNPLPSGADRAMTAHVAETVGQGFKGHLVLNHQTYGFINRRGESPGVVKLPSPPASDPLREFRGLTIDKTITQPSDAAFIGADLFKLTPENSAAIMTVGARGEVTSAVTLPLAVLRGKRGSALLAQIGKRGASIRNFAVLPYSKLDELRGPLRQAMIAGLIRDAVFVAETGDTYLLSGEIDVGTDFDAVLARRGRADRGVVVKDEDADAGSVRSPVQPYGRKEPPAGDGSRYTPDQEAALAKAGLAVDKRSRMDKVRDWFKDEAAKVREALQDPDSRRQALVDRFHGIRAAEARAGGLGATESPYIAARLTTGLASTMEAIMLYGAPQWRDGVLNFKPGTKGLLESLRPVQDDINDWLGWMVGRRAQVLKRQGRENNLSDADIAALLSLGDGKKSVFEQAAKDYLTLKNAILDVAQESGLIDPQGRAAWDQVEYLPFYRQEGERAIGPGTRKGLEGQTAGIRMLKGSESALHDPLANIVRNFTKLMDASMKNHAVKLAADKLPGEFEPAPMEFKQEIIPLSQVKKHLKESGVPESAIEAIPAVSLRGMASMMAMKPPSDPDVVRVMRDGKAEYLRVKDPVLLRSLTAFKQPNKHPAIKPFIFAKRLLTQGVTTTIEFVGANFLRDAGAAWVLSDDRFIPMWDSLRGVKSALMRDASTREMMMAGSSFMGGQFYGGDPDAAAAALRRSLRAKGLKNADIEGFIGTVARSPLHLWDGWMRFSSAIENANREAVYEAAIKAGKSHAEAAFLAKDLMDFSMQGDSAFMQFFADTLPFFNARVQGLYKLGRQAAKSPKARRQMAARGGMIALASVALLAWNLSQYSDGWDELEDWDKDTYWHIAPGTKFHTRIPKPFELGLAFGTAPERMAAAILGEDSSDQTFLSLLRAITGTLAFNPIPQAVLPIVESWANKRFFTGRQIENPGDEKLLPEAREEWYTSDTMQLLADYVGNSTGQSAKRLEHLWIGYTGGLGAYVLEASDWVLRTIDGGPDRPDMAMRDFPVAGRFLRGDAPPRSTRYTTEFYQMLNDAQQIEGTVKTYWERDKTDDDAKIKRAIELGKKHKILLGPIFYDKRIKGGFGFQNVRLMRKAQKELTSLRDAADAVVMSRELTPEQKREQLDKIQARRNRLAKRVVEKIRGTAAAKPK